MRNQVKISSMLILGALLAACGQSGPLYTPGQAVGVHKKDVFLLKEDEGKTKTSAVKDSAPDKTKPLANASQVTPKETEQQNKPTG